MHGPDMTDKAVAWVKFKQTLTPDKPFGRPDLMAGRTSLTFAEGMVGMQENVFINARTSRRRSRRTSRFRPAEPTERSS